MEAQLIDDRKRVFQRPKTKEEVIRGRESLFVSKLDDLLPAIENRRKDQAILIHPSVELIPGQAKGVLEYQDAVNFGKRGNLVQIPTFPTEEEAIERKWGDLRARREAWERYKHRAKEPFVGWFWLDPEGYAHIVHPSTTIEGHRLYMYGFKSMNIAEKTTVVPGIKKRYTAADTNLRNIRVLVPSRSEEGKREVVIEHLTDPNDPASFAEWTRIRTRHDCPLKAEDFSFRFKHYVTYCPHDAAGLASISRKYAEEHKRILNQPFSLFSEPMLRAFITLSYHTVKADIIKDGTIIRQRIRPLAFSEIDRSLMYAWLEFGNKATLYAHPPAPTKSYKLMRDFDWSVDGPGMPFIDKIRR